MFTEEIIKRLPEYQNVVVSKPVLKGIDENVNPLDYVQESDFMQQIIGVDPDTCFPRNDLTVLEDVTTNNEVREFILRCLRSHPILSHPELDDDSLFDMIKNKFENVSDYVDRIDKKYIQPFEEVSSE